MLCRTYNIKDITDYDVRTATGNIFEQKNTLDFDQSNYSSRIVFSWIGLLTELGPTGNSAIRSADRENPTIEPNIK